MIAESSLTRRCFWLGLSLLGGCQSSGRPSAHTPQRREGGSGPPGQSTFRYSRQLVAEYYDGFKVVRFSAANQQAEETWLLVERHQKVPRGFPGAKVIRTPVRRLAVGTYRYGGLLDQLGLADTLVAYGNTRLVTAPSIRARIDRGEISRNFTAELVAGLEADVLLNYYSNSDLLTWDNVDRRLGILSLPMAEHLEPDPLARAEWIKLIGMLFHLELNTNSRFEEIEAKYQSVVAELPVVRERPRVTVQIPSGDYWYIYGGRNQLAHLIRSAGGDYIWSEDSSFGSMQRIPFEVGYDRSLSADLWIIGADFAGRADLNRWVAGHKYLSRLPAYHRHRAYAACSSNSAEGNPYWDYALVEPHEELLDHVAMMHPQHVAGRRMRFYRPL